MTGYKVIKRTRMCFGRTDRAFTIGRSQLCGGALIICYMVFFNTNKRTNKKKKSDKPNIIVIMTDDQDEALGKNVQIKLFKTYQFINFVASLAKFK